MNRKWNFHGDKKPNWSTVNGLCKTGLKGPMMFEVLLQPTFFFKPLFVESSKLEKIGLKKKNNNKFTLANNKITLI